MATSSLQSDLTCSVCLELYKEPLLLKCMHSFCRDCLLQISTTNPAAEEDARNICNSKQQELFKQQAGKVFECPDCRYVVTLDDEGVDGLPKNFTLRNIVENFKKNNDIETKPQYPCTVCTEEPPGESIKYCRQCCICYCKVCLEQLHPNRGALAKHVLVRPSDQAIDSTSKTESQKDTTSRSEIIAVDKRRWCSTCHVVYSGDFRESDKHNWHRTLSLREAKVQKMRDMEKKALDLEQTKRKINHMITDAEDSVEHFKEDAQKRSMEIKNYADKMREQLQNHISAKERECLTSFKRDMSSKMEKIQNQVGDGKQQLSEIGHILQDIGETHEELDDEAFVKKMSEIEERVKKVQEKPIQVDSDKLVASSDSLCDLKKSLEKLKSATVANTEKLTNPKGTKTAKTSETLSTAVSNVKATKIPCQHYAMVKLSWTKEQGQTYDVKMVSRSETGLETAFYIYDVPGDITVHRLRFSAVYDITVSVHKQPGIVSKVLKVCMLEKINCQEFSFNTKKGHSSMRYSSCGKKMAHEVTKSWDEEALKKVEGTVGTCEIKGGNMYWEVKATFLIPRKNDQCVFDLGICSKQKIDRIRDLYKNYNGYSCTFVKRGKYREMALEFDAEGKTSGTSTVFSNTEAIHLGFFVNMDKKTFSVIDVENNRLCYTFADIKGQTVYLPVFGHIDEDFEIVLELITGSQIQKLPDLEHLL